MIILHITNGIYIPKLTQRTYRHTLTYTHTHTHTQHTHTHTHTHTYTHTHNTPTHTQHTHTHTHPHTHIHTHMQTVSSGMMWCDMGLIRLVKQVLQFYVYGSIVSGV